MFDFIKKLFVKEEILKEEIKLEGLSDWFNSKTKSIFAELDSKIGGIIGRVNEEKEKTKNNLEVLKNAKLQNPNIPFKANQLMEGNREAYIKKVAVFMNQISFEKDYKKLRDFCISFDSMLDNFGKSTLKPYHVLQEFFANESRNIAMNIKNFDNLIKEMKGIIEEQSPDKYEKLKGSIDNLWIQVNLKNKLNDDLGKVTYLDEELGGVRGSLEEGIKKLKSSEGYSNLKNLEETKGGIEKDFNDNNYLLIHFFSVIEAALKKYARVAFEDEKLINDYLQNPVGTLLGDKELKITGILEKLNKSVSDNKIELKYRKKERTLEELGKIDKEFFNNFVKMHNELDIKLEEANKSIDENETRKVLEEHEMNLKKTNEDGVNSEQKIESIKKEIERIDIDGIKKELEKEIKGLLKVEVAIS